jgi:hypothetical protein
MYSHEKIYRHRIELLLLPVHVVAFLHGLRRGDEQLIKQEAEGNSCDLRRYYLNISQQ